ncbi:MAG: hypothetical protein LC104_01755 [Bacteroidales bacterium]|nr:hypothetical protein [Bacteroidales bacterium]
MRHHGHENPWAGVIVLVERVPGDYDSHLSGEAKGLPMPWIVGIDEAGYGPNLGPLVQAAVSVFLPDHDTAGWATLQPCLRRAAEKDDGRLCVDDSKKVYARSGGFARLERGVFLGLGLPTGALSGLLSQVCHTEVLTELRGEVWFDGNDPLPVQCPPEPAWTLVEGVRIGSIAANLVPAPQFNKILAGSGSKGTILAAGLVGLLQTVTSALPTGEPILALCDKQGGRHYYAPLLQSAFPGGWIVTECETPAESRYRVEGLDRSVTVLFRPRADADGVSVAWASMLAKYLREVCMRQFNRYWQTHLPDLKPTAGYPVDAKRFFAAIQPVMEKLSIPHESVWRLK